MKEKLNIQLLTAAILSIGGLVMLFCGIYIEPLGQIHDSLLIGFGEVATFAGALFGIDYTYKIRNYHDNPTNQKTNDHRPSTNDQSSRSRLYKWSFLMKRQVSTMKMALDRKSVV